MENVRKHRKEKRYFFVSEPNYHTTKFFAENLLAIELRKTQILMKKLVYLGLSILDLSKTVMENKLKMQNFVIWIQTAPFFM